MSVACPAQNRREAAEYTHNNQNETVQQEIVHIREMFVGSGVMVRRVERRIERDDGERLADKDDTLFTDINASRSMGRTQGPTLVRTHKTQ